MDRGRRQSTAPERFNPTPEPLYRRLNKSGRAAAAPSAVGDFTCEGVPFLCDVCKSCVYNSRKRGVGQPAGSAKYVQPCVRYTDEGARLSLCLLCGISHDRKRNNPEAGSERPDGAERSDKIREQRTALLQSVRACCADPRVESLVCSERMASCNATTHFLCGDSLADRVRLLLSVMDTAHKLRDSKDPSRLNSDGKVGLGNGKKRSRKYEEFVLQKRAALKQEMGVCEHVAQKILGYSNNFLHKRLLTEKRRNRVAGPPKVDLTPVTSLWTQKCCRDHCVRLSRSHFNLVSRWRQLSLESRHGLQQAVAELLTPSAGARTNCYKFVTMVTGASPTTIAKVSKKLQRNGGVLGPQEHGLRDYWRKKKEENGEQEVDANYEPPTVWSVPQHHPDEIDLQQRLDRQSKELEQLRAQLREQRRQLVHQNQLLSQSNPQRPADAQPRSDPGQAVRAPPATVCHATDQPTGQWLETLTGQRLETLTGQRLETLTAFDGSGGVLGACPVIDSSGGIETSPFLVERVDTRPPPNLSLYDVRQVLNQTGGGATCSGGQAPWLCMQQTEEPGQGWHSTGYLHTLHQL